MLTALIFNVRRVRHWYSTAHGEQNSFTLMHYAAQSGDVAVLRFLCSRDAKADARNKVSAGIVCTDA